MTRPHALPLDGDALDRIDGEYIREGDVAPGEFGDLLEQARAALALEAERDALKAQVERLVALLESDAATFDAMPAAASWVAERRAAIRATPAQSLAAHDAEVRANALREVLPDALRRAHNAGWEHRNGGEWESNETILSAILALAERAPEVER